MLVPGHGSPGKIRSCKKKQSLYIIIICLWFSTFIFADLLLAMIAALWFYDVSRCSPILKFPKHHGHPLPIVGFKLRSAIDCWQSAGSKRKKTCCFMVSAHGSPFFSCDELVFGKRIVFSLALVTLFQQKHWAKLCGSCTKNAHATIQRCLV